MKPILWTLLVLAAPAAFAASLQENFLQAPACSGPIAVSETHAAVTTNFHDVQIMTADGTPSRNFSGTQAVKDLALYKNTLVILRAKQIEEWDLVTGRMMSQSPTSGADLPSGAEARTMALWRDKIVIAHGRLGYAVYSLSEHRPLGDHPLLQEQLPLESDITGVVVQDDRAIFSATGYSLTGTWSEPAFRGFVIVNLRTKTVERELKGLDAGSRGLALFGPSVLVDFGGLLQVFDIQDLFQRDRIRRRRSHWNFPGITRLLPGFSVENNQIWGCGLNRINGVSSLRPVLLSGSAIGF